MVQFKGSDRANFKNFNLKIFHNLPLSGHFKTCIDSSLNKTRLITMRSKPDYVEFVLFCCSCC